ncbi:MAG: thiamine-phosphate synthase family protein [Halobacteriales archaeon]
MTFTLPEQVVVEEFLPAFRSALATKLDEGGMTQQEISDCIGVSQPAVSKYVSGEVSVEDVVTSDPGFERTVEELAAGYLEGNLGEFEALGRALDLVETMEDRGPICELHERRQPDLRGRGCDLCVGGSRSSRESLVLDDVRRAARKLESAAGAGELVPNVGSNVARALEGAEDVLDVAAIPGRIYVMRGRVYVPSQPEFGASENVARVALKSLDRGGGGGAVNVATHDGLLDAARSLGYTVREFDAGRGERASELESAMSTGVPDVVYHRGGFAVEPVSYFLGDSAVDAVDRLLEAAGLWREERDE